MRLIWYYYWTTNFFFKKNKLTECVLTPSLMWGPIPIRGEQTTTKNCESWRANIEKELQIGEVVGTHNLLLNQALISC